jgi:hypothetical protein
VAPPFDRLRVTPLCASQHCISSVSLSLSKAKRANNAGEDAGAPQALTLHRYNTDHRNALYVGVIFALELLAEHVRIDFTVEHVEIR